MAGGIFPPNYLEGLNSRANAADHMPKKQKSTPFSTTVKGNSGFNSREAVDHSRQLSTHTGPFYRH